MQVHHNLELTKENATNDLEYCYANSKSAVASNEHIYTKESPLLYLTSNERLNKITEEDIKENDTVLTVAGGGDYLLEATHLGAKEVVAFDINSRQYYPTWLKLTALELLDYEEFYAFFDRYFNNKYLAREIFYKIFNKIGDTPEVAFWDSYIAKRKIEFDIAEEYKLRFMYDYPYEKLANYWHAERRGRLRIEDYEYAIECLIKEKTLFHTDIMLRHLGFGRHIYGYLKNEEAFKKTKTRLEEIKISFYNYCISELYKLKEYKGKIDAAFLSNIHTFMPPTEYAEALDLGVYPLIKKGGNINLVSLNSVKKIFEESNHSAVEALLSRPECSKTMDFYNNIEVYKELRNLGYSFLLREMETFIDREASLIPTDVIMQIRKNK